MKDELRRSYTHWTQCAGYADAKEKRIQRKQAKRRSDRLWRKAAFVLLCSCAPVAIQPSSLPTIRIDRTVAGVVCSRSGAEVIAALRLRERNDYELKLIECDGATRLAQARETEANKRAKSAEWWNIYGPAITAFAGVASVLAVVGFAKQ